MNFKERREYCVVRKSERQSRPKIKCCIWYVQTIRTHNYNRKGRSCQPMLLNSNSSTLSLTAGSLTKEICCCCCLLIRKFLFEHEKCLLISCFLSANCTCLDFIFRAKIYVSFFRLFFHPIFFFDCAVLLTVVSYQKVKQKILWLPLH